MSKVIDLNGEDEFEKEVIKSKTPVLVGFWAPWCGPCQMMAPILEEIVKELDGMIKIAKLDTEASEHIGLAQKYNIMSIPNMKLFFKGKVIDEFIGLRSKEMLLEDLKKHIDKKSEK